ncbi:MAG: hypothetical protein DFNUSKGM_000871 [Candidatus Fervidibacter sacchari]
MQKSGLSSVPFRPVVFNPALGDLSQLIAPPYDVIDPKQCEQLLAKHPCNVVRLILPPSLNPDDPSRYSNAAKLWKQWLEEQALVEIEELSVFVYAQRFSIGRKRKEHISLLTTIPLLNYESGLIRPHEHTMPKPKSDRLTLLRLMGAELGQVHGLLSDDTGEWHELLQSATSAPVWLRGELDGVEHIVWRITDPVFNEEVNRLLDQQWLVIADGHHRYETALTFREEVLEAKTDPNHPANFIGIVIADHQRNATVLPTHRLVRFPSFEDAERVLQEIRRHFRVSKVNWDGDEKVLSQIFQDHSGIPFLFVAQGQALLVTVTGVEGTVCQYIQQLPLPLRKVDTAVLHQAVLPVIFAAVGLKPSDLTIDYTHDSTSAFQFAQREGNLAILLRPISPELVCEVAKQGYRLPPKTTYFVPKVPSGLVMRKILSSQEISAKER